MNIHVKNSQNRVKVSEQLVGLIKDAVKKSIELECTSSDFEVNILLVDNKRIRQINQTYRGKDNPTDVLSFPMIDEGAVDMLKGEIEVGKENINPETNLLVLGDIVISLEKACEQADEYGHLFERELAFLVTHGMFHLLGYDHKDGQTYMFEKQEEVLRNMNLTRVVGEGDDYEE